MFPDVIDPSNDFYSYHCIGVLFTLQQMLQSTVDNRTRSTYGHGFDDTS